MSKTNFLKINYCNNPRYLAKALERDGMENEVFPAGKPLIIIGDSPSALTQNAEDNVGIYINRPTISIVNEIPKRSPYVVGMYGIGKFEATATFDKSGILSINSIVVPKLKLQSLQERKEYDYYGVENPYFKTLYDMQSLTEDGDSVFNTSAIERTPEEEMAKVFPGVKVDEIRFAAKRLRDFGIDYYSSGVVINGTNNAIPKELTMNLFETLRVPVKYIQIADIDTEFLAAGMIGQRGVNIAQELLTEMKDKYDKYIKFDLTIHAESGKSPKIITMITKKQTR